VLVVMACTPVDPQPTPQGTAPAAEVVPSPSPAPVVEPAPEPARFRLWSESAELLPPAHGRFEAAYDYDFERYPTREIHVVDEIDGHVILVLDPGGPVTACFAGRHVHAYSRSRHASHDGEEQRERRDDRFILGGRGVARSDGERMVVTIDEFWRGSCTPNAESRERGSLVLTCAHLREDEFLPMNMLACELTEPTRGLDRLAVSILDTPRAGPYTLQDDGTFREPFERGTPWLLLGGRPGLLVQSRDERHGPPQVALELSERPFVEANFRPVEGEP
jgi:hypothetical protein